MDITSVPNEYENRREMITFSLFGAKEKNCDRLHSNKIKRQTFELN